MGTLVSQKVVSKGCHFISPNKFKSPEYPYIEIPQECQLAYNLRNPGAYEQPRPELFVTQTPIFITHYSSGIC